MSLEPLLLFSLDADPALGGQIAEAIGGALAPHELREFGGGEHKTRPMVEVAGSDVFVLHRLNGEPGCSANDKLVRLLFFAGALKQSGAARVTALAPYLPYSRKDRRTKPRDPVSTRYLAALFEAVGTDRLVTLEAHNVSALENAFRRCLPENVPSARLLAQHLAPSLGSTPVTVVSPDAGGTKRAALFRRELEAAIGRPVETAFMEKHRSAGIVSGSLFAGDVAGRLAIVVDDLIASGTTIVRTAAACRAAGAIEVVAAAAHGMFAADAPLFGAEGPERIVVTDSVPLSGDLDQHARERLDVASAAGLLGEVILRLHRGTGLSDLIPYD